MLCAFFPKFPFHSNDNRYYIILFVKAAWSDFLTITISNNFPYKSIILKSYRQWPIYSSSCARSEPRNAPPYYDFELRTQFLWNKIWPHTFPRFSPYVHSFIMANHYLTFIRINNFSPIFFNRPSPIFPDTTRAVFFYSLLLSSTFSFLLSV